MKWLTRTSLIFSLLFAHSAFVSANCNSLLDYESKKLRSKETINFCEKFSGKTLLVVNTASRCGFTPQLAQLEALYQKYKNKGLEIIGFPSNSFRQELPSEEQTASVCFKNYGVSFTMLAPSDVTGPEQNKFYQELSRETGHSPNWNFNKYLISSDHKEITLFRSQIAPINSALEIAISKITK